MIGFSEMAFLYVVPSSSIIHFRHRMFFFDDDLFNNSGSVTQIGTLPQGKMADWKGSLSMTTQVALSKDI